MEQSTSSAVPGNDPEREVPIDAPGAGEEPAAPEHQQPQQREQRRQPRPDGARDARPVDRGALSETGQY
ncbi:hypothetical protein NB037_16535, partial [Rathayibacter sp. ZW T2_19]|nr:hypothetical protein [Rathayibacter rubneri]